MSPSTERKAFYQTQQMMRLMENVFMDLDFDVERNWKKPDNAGWHELFLKWGSSQTLQAAWEKSQSSYNQRFQLFCKEKGIFAEQRNPR